MVTKCKLSEISTLVLGRTIGCKGVIVNIDDSCYPEMIEIQPDEFHDEGDLWPFEEKELRVIQ